MTPNLVDRRIEENFGHLLILGRCAGKDIPAAQHKYWRSEIRRLARTMKLRVRTGISEQGGENNQGMPFALLIDFDGISANEWEEGLKTLGSAAEVIRHFAHQKRTPTHLTLVDDG